MPSLKSSLRNSLKAWLKPIGLLSSIAVLFGYMTSQNALSTSIPQTPQASLKQSLSSSPAQSSQGSIEGEVTQLSGNHMPSSAPNPAARSEPVATTLWIFTGKIANPGSPYWPIAEAQQHPSFLRQIASNDEGHYSVTLSPGEYTVFMQSGDALYLNTFQRDGSYRSVEVVANQITTFNLVNTTEASF